MGFGAAKICSAVLIYLKRRLANKPRNTHAQVEVKSVNTEPVPDTLETGDPKSLLEESRYCTVNNNNTSQLDLKFNNDLECSNNEYLGNIGPIKSGCEWTALDSTDSLVQSNQTRLPSNEEKMFDSELSDDSNTHSITNGKLTGKLNIGDDDQNFISPNLTDALKSRLGPVRIVSKNNVVESQHCLSSNEFFIWVILFSIVSFIILVLVCLGSDDTTDPDGLSVETRRDIRRSVLLAPIGAWVRWGLTRIPQLKALWPEINPQTLVANQSAVAIMVLLLVHCQSNEWTFPVNTG